MHFITLQKYYIYVASMLINCRKMFTFLLIPNSNTQTSQLLSLSTSQLRTLLYNLEKSSTFALVIKKRAINNYQFLIIPVSALDQIKKPIVLSFHQFEEAYANALQTGNPLLQQVFDHLVAGRGKLLRPILVLLAAEKAHGVNEKTIQTAVALELLHTASLVHDDVVDNSPLRRGLPSVQNVWGNKVAVLTGDFLLSKVISLISNLRNLQILNIISDLGMTLSSGEILQLHQKDGMWITEDDYFAIISQKTAQLFASCAEAGAASSGGTMRQLTAMRQYGMHLGICFQLKDDVLDYSDNEEIGKPTLQDIRDGKVTLPLLKAMERASAEERLYIRHLAESDLTFETENEIKSFVLRYDGVRYTYKKMEEHRQKALAALAIFHDDATTEALRALLDYAIVRVY